MVLLTTRPLTLRDLWVESQFGGGGQKPVKDFNLGEHCALKNRYCFCKVLWYKVAEMIPMDALEPIMALS